MEVCTSETVDGEIRACSFFSPLDAAESNTKVVFFFSFPLSNVFFSQVKSDGIGQTGWDDTSVVKVTDRISTTRLRISPRWSEINIDENIECGDTLSQLLKWVLRGD